MLRLPSMMRRVSVGRSHGIVLFCWGGMSQLESWDPKPEAPAEVRGDYKAIETAIPGVRIGEYLPSVAQQTERLAIVRSCRHRARDHRQAAYWTLTGTPPIQLDGVMVSNPILPTRNDKPGLGSMVGYVIRTESELPGTVTLPYPVAERGADWRSECRISGCAARPVDRTSQGRCAVPRGFAAIRHSGVRWHGRCRPSEAAGARATVGTA